MKFRPEQQVWPKKKVAWLQNSGVGFFFCFVFFFSLPNTDYQELVHLGNPCRCIDWVSASPLPHDCRKSRCKAYSLGKTVASLRLHVNYVGIGGAQIKSLTSNDN